MVYIESAFLGDEKASRNVTKVLNDKIVGSTIDVPVDDALIPAFAVTEKAEVTDADTKKIRTTAEQMCGGGSDQNCVKVRVAELTQSALAEKQQQAVSSANVVQGRRLTVNILTDEGKRKQLIVPDGQKFTLNGMSPTDPRKANQMFPSFDYFKGQFIEFVSIAALTFAWVFGIVATYAIFSRMGWGYIAWALTFVAFILPGSGYVMIFGYFIVQSFVENYTSMV
jgi:hypothetical protein